MNVEEDGDEVFIPLAAGCQVCVVWEGDVPTHPQLVVRDGFWRCPECNGSYGPAGTT